MQLDEYHASSERIDTHQLSVMTSHYSPTKMLSSALQCGLPSLRWTISDYGLRSRSKSTEMVVHRRSETTDVVLAQSTIEMSPELKCKLSLHGFNLLQASIAESHGTAPNSKTLSRQMYLDSLSYLLQGLPSDLNVQEVTLLQKSVPLEVQTPSQPGIQKPSADSVKRPSMLHRGLASMIIVFCLVLRLFLPYIRFLISTAYRYERSYHVSEKLFATTMSATDSIGRKAIEIASTALGSELVLGTVAYCIDGVCGGVTEGLVEGMKAIDTRKA